MRILCFPAVVRDLNFDDFMPGFLLGKNLLCPGQYMIKAVGADPGFIHTGLLRIAHDTGSAGDRLGDYFAVFKQLNPRRFFS